MLDVKGSIIEALKLDLNKPEFESYATEVGIVLEETFNEEYICGRRGSAEKLNTFLNAH